MSRLGSDGPSFVDANVLIYAIAADDSKRSPVVQNLLRKVMIDRSLRTSTQVLQELYATVRRAIELSMGSMLSYWERLSSWPAERSEAKVLYSADL